MSESGVKTIAWTPSVLEGVDTLRRRAQRMRRGALVIFAAALLGGLVALGASMMENPADAMQILQEVHLPGDLQAKVLAAAAPAASEGTAIGQALPFSAPIGSLLDLMDGAVFKIFALTSFMLGAVLGVVKGDVTPVVVSLALALGVSLLPPVIKGMTGEVGEGVQHASGAGAATTSEERLQRLLHQPGLVDLKQALKAASVDRLTTDYVLAQASLLAPAAGGQRATLDQARGMAEELAHSEEVSAMGQLRPEVLYALETRLLGQAVSKPAKLWTVEMQRRVERWRLVSRAALSCFAVLLLGGLVSGILALLIASRVGRLQFLTASTAAAGQS